MRISISLNKIYVSLLSILIFFMICIPRDMQMLKIFILLLLVILALYRKIKWTLLQKELIIIYLLYAVPTMIIGIINRNDTSNIIDFIRLNIVYTILLAIVFHGEVTEKIRNKLINTLFYATWFVSGYSIVLLLVGIGIWPRHLFIELADANVGIHEGYTHITNTNLSFFLFLLPMLMWMAINGYSSSNISKTKIWITTIVATIVTFASGRRILWIAIFFPIAIYVMRALGKGRKSQIVKVVLLMLGGTIALLALTMTGYFDIEFLLERFLSAFSQMESDWGVQYENVRFIQIKELWNGFLENPIWGAGAGGVLINGYKRAPDGMSFEMTYNYILFQSGMILTAIYVLFFVYIIFRLLNGAKKLPKKEKILLESITIGLVMSIIGNATNPYFSSSFDFMWMIYLPFFFVGMINTNNTQDNSAIKLEGECV